MLKIIQAEVKSLYFAKYFLCAVHLAKSEVAELSEALDDLGCGSAYLSLVEEGTTTVTSF